MALTVYTSKDNQWREYVNPLRGLTLERIVSLIEQGERKAFADLQFSSIWPCAGSREGRSRLSAQRH